MIAVNRSPLCVAAPARSAEESATAARDALIEANLELVSAVARQVAASFPRHVDREELVRAGMVGLVEAADRYDAGTGVPFASFAARRIRGAMIDSMRAHDWAPRSVRSAGRCLDDAEHVLTTELGRTPTAAEVATAAGMTVGEAAAVRHRETRAVVLTLEGFFEGEGDDPSTGLADVLYDATVPLPVEQLELAEMHGYVQDAVSLLPARHRQVIHGYFYGSASCEEMANQLGVSISRISQIKAQALDMLRDGLVAAFGDTRTRPPLTAAVAVA